ncbi:aquaporin-like protein [Limtongia smithiae]|uniref:aquaporin-like protein n=1 Tax=Limtongia smithiae TaxID=1125753 RepID=UPI0034D018EA
MLSYLRRSPRASFSPHTPPFSSTPSLALPTTVMPDSEIAYAGTSTPAPAGEKLEVTYEEDFLRRDDIRGADERQLEAEERRQGITVTRYKHIRRMLREPLSEMLGCVMLIVCGDGAVAQSVLSSNANGNYQSINLSYGFGVLFGFLIATAGGAAGHLNPAVTLTSCLFRKFPWRKLPIYFLMQMIGCGIGALIVYGSYRTALTNYDGGVRHAEGDLNTAGIFFTYPESFMDLPARVMQEYVGAIMLAFVIGAVGCASTPRLSYTLPAEWNLVRGLVLAFGIYTIGSAAGWQTGYALNPARDFGPRVAMYIVGYGTAVWENNERYFWIPLVIPFVGSISGQLIFDFMVYEGDVDSFATDPTIAVNKLKTLVRGEASKSESSEDGKLENSLNSSV